MYNIKHFLILLILTCTANNAFCQVTNDEIFVDDSWHYMKSFAIRIYDIHIGVTQVTLYFELNAFAYIEYLEVYDTNANRTYLTSNGEIFDGVLHNRIYETNKINIGEKRYFSIPYSFSGKDSNLTGMFSLYNLYFWIKKKGIEKYSKENIFFLTSNTKDKNTQPKTKEKNTQPSIKEPLKK